MSVLISAEIDRTSGWARLRFPYDPATVATIKAVPGLIWKKDQKAWYAPINALPVLAASGLKFQEAPSIQRSSPQLPAFASRLRPYQQEAANYLLDRQGALLTMDPRTGKTPVAIAGVCALVGAGLANAAVFLYPNAVRGEWADQLRQWAGIELRYLEGFDPISEGAINVIRALPFVAIGCHYEILEKHWDDLQAILGGRRYVAVADELHYCKNRKIKRTEVLWDLVHAGACVARWGLTGTPMRNRPRDLWALFQFCGEGQAGNYWHFAKRYCAAFRGEFGWDDTGESNTEELAKRLTAISYRKTRQEVAAWLPAVDRKAIMCSVPEAFMRQYRKLENAFAPGLKSALSGDPSSGAEQHLRQLTAATGKAKIPTAIERALEHCARGVKVLIGSVHHDVLNDVWTALENNAARTVADIPFFCAGGWMTLDKRRAAIDRWKQTTGPAILIANMLSSGIGIDLSQADVQISLEVPWVPADLKQWEDRIQDVHKGTRTSPPLYEYLLVKDTIDTAICAAQLKKLRTIDAVVGIDAQTRGMGEVLKGAGVVDASRLGLDNTGEDAVNAALLSMQARLMGAVSDPEDTLALDVESAFEEEAEQHDDEEAAG